ncbi:hypothetical protein PHJA_000242600 [Phtheirospermum japonicum]|uniref:Transcription factor CBF/NF-Y/archaeal histone domain-containing protein n=1 Tax=Phtheirospermum japonicum TaxID=374723 RepID=A0A830B950_9LAMI|nr:hypothetical protein PHJA_000242600 [Phtheirospermum japonicum]
MAKKNQVEVPTERNINQKKSETEKKQNKAKGKNPTTIDTKTKSKSRSNSNKARKTATDDASSEENEVLVAPSSSTESQNDDVFESSEAEDDRVDEKAEKKNSKSKEEKMPPKSPKRKTEKEDAKDKGKKRSKKEENDVEPDAEEKSDNAFPMNRISRIIRSDNPNIRISQEAVFLINRASEKFLQLFCREAYACSFLEDKTYTAYNHLSNNQVPNAIPVEQVAAPPPPPQNPVGPIGVADPAWDLVAERRQEADRDRNAAANQRARYGPPPVRANVRHEPDPSVDLFDCRLVPLRQLSLPRSIKLSS